MKYPFNTSNKEKKIHSIDVFPAAYFQKKEKESKYAKQRSFH
jgi:hypothetical protein